MLSEEANVFTKNTGSELLARRRSHVIHPRRGINGRMLQPSL